MYKTSARLVSSTCFVPSLSQTYHYPQKGAIIITEGDTNMLPSLDILGVISMECYLQTNLHIHMANNLDRQKLIEDFKLMREHMSWFLDSEYCDGYHIADAMTIMNTPSTIERREADAYLRLLGSVQIDCLVDSYEDKYPKYFMARDMRYGYIEDDGYRGVHLFFQLTTQHYPIQLNVYTHEDYLFNKWIKENLDKNSIDYYLIARFLRDCFEANPKMTYDDLTLQYTKSLQVLNDYEQNLETVDK